MLDSVTDYLFCDSFPREVGAKRNLCNSQLQFEKQIDLLNGVDEVFTNANPLNGEINKIPFDFDGLPTALYESQKVYLHLLNCGIPTVPVVSGKKGIHLHASFKARKEPDNREILYKTTKSLLLKSLPESKSVDSHLIGNTRALIRVPNTLRPPENSSFCSYLPTGKAFLEMNIEDLNWYMRGTHVYPIEDYNFHSLPTFEEFISPEVDDKQLKFGDFDTSVTTHYADNESLQHFLRPCLYRLMTVAEPRHKVRVAATADLLRADLNPNEILAMYKSLGWRDFDESWCAYQINHVKKIQFSKNKLTGLGICFSCGRSCF